MLNVPERLPLMDRCRMLVAPSSCRVRYSVLTSSGSGRDVFGTSR